LGLQAILGRRSARDGCPLAKILPNEQGSDETRLGSDPFHLRRAWRDGRRNCHQCLHRSRVPDICASLPQQGRLVYSTTTDAPGHFRIDNVPDGVYAAEYSQRCDAIHPDWSLPGGPPFSVKADATPAHLEFKLEMLGKLSGKILDPPGAPVPVRR
jgi:hypothetical protein